MSYEKEATAACWRTPAQPGDRRNQRASSGFMRKVQSCAKPSRATYILPVAMQRA